MSNQHTLGSGPKAWFENASRDCKNFDKEASFNFNTFSGLHTDKYHK